MDQAVIKKLDIFFSTYPRQTYKKGDILIQAGTEPKGIYYIEKGIIRNYWISEEGNEVTLNMYKPHAFLPMSWAIAGIPNNHFYEAMENVEVRLAPKQQVLAFLKDQPDVLFDLLKRIYIGMDGLWRHIESLTSGNSYNKLVSSLIILSKRFGEKNQDQTVVQLKMSERDIANYAGISRETASRELQKLKKERLVVFEKGFITVRDVTLLEHIIQ